MGLLVVLGGIATLAASDSSSVSSNSSNSSWVFVLVGASFLVLLLTRNGLVKRGVLNLPPGPPNLPFIGALKDVKPPMHKAFQRLAAKYGPIVYLRLGVQPLVVVSSAEAAQEVLQHKDSEFADRSTFMTGSAARYAGFESAALPWADFNAQTKLIRKVTRTEFFTGVKLKAHEEIRTRETATLVEKLFSEPGLVSSNDDQTTIVGIRAAATGVMTNVMYQLNFGKRFDDLQPGSKLRKVPAIFEDRLKIFTKFNMVDYFPSRILGWLDPQGLLRELKDLEKRHIEVYGAVLEEHRRIRQSARLSNEAKTINLVDVLLQVQEEGGEITDNGIMATFSTMVSAGIDTTAGEVEWAMLELARHPQLLQRLQAEIDGVVGQERPVQETDILAMPFLNAVITETFRLHPASGYTFPHVNVEQATIGGYDIPAKSAVFVNIFSIGRDPKVWKDPSQFNPDRFMVDGKSADVQASWNSFHLIAFGGGRRSCPGLNLAKLLVSRTVATLVHAFDWSPPPGLSAEDISSDEVGTFVLRPVTDLVLTARPRLSRRVYQNHHYRSLSRVSSNIFGITSDLFS